MPIAALVASDKGRDGVAKGLVGLLVLGLVVAITHDVVLVPLAIRYVLGRLPARVRADIEGRVVG